MLDPRQAGFRRGHNTQTALPGVIDDVRHSIDERKINILILFYVSKAFNCIPYSKLGIWASEIEHLDGSLIISPIGFKQFVMIMALPLNG